MRKQIELVISVLAAVSLSFRPHFSFSPSAVQQFGAVVAGGSLFSFSVEHCVALLSFLANGV